MSVCFVVLNYNGYDDTVECIKSLFAHINMKEHQLVVVDNGSDGVEYERLCALRSGRINFHIIETGENLGYAGGNNKGIRFAIDEGYDFVCILNNDTIIDSDFLSGCLEYMEKHEDVGFCGPAIIDYATNRIQSTGGKINVQLGRVDLIYPGRQVTDIPEIISCDYVGGACILFRTTLIEKIGLIPENYFLFFEETEWCYRAKSAGYVNVCVATSSIIHKGSQSTEKCSGLQEYLMARNRVVFVKRNIGGKLRFLLFMLYLYCGNVKRVIFDRKRFMPYFSYYKDGLTGKIDDRYLFVICKKN